MSVGSEFDALAARLLPQARTLLEAWYPAGKWDGYEFKIGNAQGEAGDSLSFNVSKGVGQDFATGEVYGDLIALYAAKQGITMGAAARELTGKAIEPDQYHRAARVNGVASPVATSEPCPTPPQDAVISRETFSHPRYGMPTLITSYRHSDGRLWYVVARYEPPSERKQIVPWTWRGRGWMPKGPETPRPLYGLPRLAQFPDARVLVVEGEKCAVIAERIFPKNPIITWVGGAKAVKKSDWGPLAGRQVYLWPDADAPGLQAMQDVANQLLPLKASIAIVDTSGQPDGWDIADADEVWSAKETADWFKAHLRVIAANGHAPPAPTATPGAPPTRDDATTIHVEQPTSMAVMWARWGLARTERGPHPNLDNALKILHGGIADGQHPPLWYDEFTNRILLGREGEKPDEWADHHTSALCIFMQRVVGIAKMSISTCHEAVMTYARTHVRNELTEWLDGLAWDETPRVSELFARGFGAEDSAYTQSVSLRFMLSLIARAYKPGCQADHMVVLEGEQGVGKSSALRILGGKWFSELHEAIGSQRWVESLHGVWLGEISELQSFRRADVDRIKAAISNREDRYRPAYGRSVVAFPRRTILAGTTNAEEWSHDDTGARRFWPVLCTTVDRDWLSEHRVQLFAEAVHRFRAGEDWYSVPDEDAKAQQEARRIADPWSERIADYCLSRTRVRMSDLLGDALGRPDKDQTRADALRVGQVMRRLGWKRTVGKDGRYWIRGGGRYHAAMKEKHPAPPVEGGDAGRETPADW